MSFLFVPSLYQKQGQFASFIVNHRHRSASHETTVFIDVSLNF